MKEHAIYIKADQNTQVDRKVIYISDVVKIYSKDTKIVDKINRLVFYRVKEDKKMNYVFSILKVFEIIQEAYPDYLLCNVGETDLIVEYTPKKKENVCWTWIKVVFVCAVTFFGAAFTIMSFNEDASVATVFEKIYEFVIGDYKKSYYLLEVSYAIGLPIGSLVFFNHFAKWKVSVDPTPLQIQLRIHEKDINQTLIDNAEREGKQIDVD